VRVLLYSSFADRLVVIVKSGKYYKSALKQICSGKDHACVAHPHLHRRKRGMTSTFSMPFPLAY
jgi:hypothetical protein